MKVWIIQEVPLNAIFVKRTKKIDGKWLSFAISVQIVVNKSCLDMRTLYQSSFTPMSSL